MGQMAIVAYASSSIKLRMGAAKTVGVGVAKLRVAWQYVEKLGWLAIDFVTAHRLKEGTTSQIRRGGDDTNKKKKKETRLEITKQPPLFSP